MCLRLLCSKQNKTIQQIAVYIKELIIVLTTINTTETKSPACFPKQMIPLLIGGMTIKFSWNIFQNICISSHLFNLNRGFFWLVVFCIWLFLRFWVVFIMIWMKKRAMQGLKAGNTNKVKLLKSLGKTLVTFSRSVDVYMQKAWI